MLPSPAEITALVQSTAAALQPYWPLFAGKAAEALGEKVPDAIVQVKEAIQKRFEKKEAAKEAFDDVLITPTDAQLQTVFQVQLRKALESDPEFVAELKKLLDKAESQPTYRADVKGKGNVVAQGGSTVNITHYAPSSDDSQKKTK